VLRAPDGSTTYETKSSRKRLDFFVSGLRDPSETMAIFSRGVLVDGTVEKAGMPVEGARIEIVSRLQVLTGA